MTGYETEVKSTLKETATSLKMNSLHLISNIVTEVIELVKLVKFLLFLFRFCCCCFSTINWWI